ncbi:MAG: hypothetical protein HY700_05830 [Gemmatimonadetes bacterium]|nr:hypothetical protein [Gemmatimonadota bacterium]
MRSYIWLAALFVWATWCPAMLSDENNARFAVDRFYNTVYDFHRHGLPDSTELARLSPLVSERLRRRFHEASAYQARARREHPDEKPPLVDEDLFSSLFEGPRRFDVGTAQPAGDHLVVHVSFEAPGDTRQGLFRWNDDVIVVKESATRFLVDDVHFLGTWDFANRGTLSELLRNTVRQGN